MPFLITSQIAVDPSVLFAIVVALVVLWDGKVWALETPRRRRWTAAASVVAGLAWVYLPRGDFWWGWLW